MSENIKNIISEKVHDEFAYIGIFVKTGLVEWLKMNRIGVSKTTPSYMIDEYGDAIVCLKGIEAFLCKNGVISESLSELKDKDVIRFINVFENLSSITHGDAENMTLILIKLLGWSPRNFENYLLSCYAGNDDISYNDIHINEHLKTYICRLIGAGHV